MQTQTPNLRHRQNDRGLQPKNIHQRRLLQRSNAHTKYIISREPAVNQEGDKLKNCTQNRTNVLATTEAQVKSRHTLSSVSDNQSGNSAKTRTKKPVSKITIRKTENYKIRLLTAIPNLYKNHRMLNVPIQHRNYKTDGFLGSDAVQSRLSENELGKISSDCPEALLQQLPPPTFKLQIANDNIVPVRNHISV